MVRRNSDLTFAYWTPQCRPGDVLRKGYPEYSGHYISDTRGQLSSWYNRLSRSTAPFFVPARDGRSGVNRNVLTALGGVAGRRRCI